MSSDESPTKNNESTKETIKEETDQNLPKNNSSTVLSKGCGKRVRRNGKSKSKLKRRRSKSKIKRKRGQRNKRKSKTSKKNVTLNEETPHSTTTLIEPLASEGILKVDINPGSTTSSNSPTSPFASPLAQTNEGKIMVYINLDDLIKLSELANQAKNQSKFNKRKGSGKRRQSKSKKSKGVNEYSSGNSKSCGTPINEVAVSRTNTKVTSNRPKTVDAMLSASKPFAGVLESDSPPHLAPYSFLAGTPPSEHELASKISLGKSLQESSLGPSIPPISSSTQNLTPCADSQTQTAVPLAGSAILCTSPVTKEAILNPIQSNVSTCSLHPETAGTGISVSPHLLSPTSETPLASTASVGSLARNVSGAVQSPVVPLLPIGNSDTFFKSQIEANPSGLPELSKVQPIASPNGSKQEQPETFSVVPPGQETILSSPTVTPLLNLSTKTNSNSTLPEAK